MKDQREFARIPVTISAGIRPLEDEEVEELRIQLRIRASVWAPTDETALREVVTSGAGTTEAVLAQAVLDLTAQIVRLRMRLDSSEKLYSIELVQLSGGGGQFCTELPVQVGEYLELRLEDEENDMPPLRALIEIVHRDASVPAACGFRFDTIHPQDQERLIRLIYQLQREALRHSQLQTN